ncbi:hypothetical protein, partial [Haemophilus influenzae]|uniref:hypothetical protein n=1 Tax=Haemophilus influenzae TaxID=727 RepID=UPI0013A6EDA0
TYQMELNRDRDRDQIQRILQINLCERSNQNILIHRLIGLQQVKAPGEAKSDLWQLMEFAKYFTTDEMWTEDLLAQMPEYRG